MERVGIIGVGLVGTAIAERLLSAGYTVIGYDVRSEQLGTLAAVGRRGGLLCRDGRIVLRSRGAEFAHVGDCGDVITEIRSKLRAGALVIDTTTGAPEDAVRFGRNTKRGGIDYVDATVGGSSRQVANGKRSSFAAVPRALLRAAATCSRNAANRHFLLDLREAAPE